jgi:hypothetical protein
MKAILFSLWMFLLSSILYAQSGIYHPMPGSGAIWREYFGGYEVNCRDYQTTITGDTLIGDKTYQKLQQFGVNIMNVSGNCLSHFWSVYNVYIGAYRNDSIEKKVFFIPTGSTTEELLYDFNLELNDKLPETYSYRYSFSDTSYISLVDSVLIGNEYHKRYGVSNSIQTDYVYLIEGIGSSFGLLSELHAPFEFGSMLLCYKQDYVTVYPDPGYDCVLVTGLDEHPRVINYFSISPNPIVSGIGVVNIPPRIPASELIINDVVGNEITRIRNVEQGTIIHTENLGSGVYLYRVMTGKQIYHAGKLMVLSK